MTTDEPNQGDGPGATAPWLFTCRHDHEDRLLEELSRSGCSGSGANVLLPGLVRVDGLPAEATQTALTRLDPAWALQVLPAVRALEGDSIRALARAAVDELAPGLDTFDGPWQLHGLVPGMFKGQPKPAMARRIQLVVEAIEGELKRKRRRAWRRLDRGCHRPAAVAQVLMLEPERIWFSLTMCTHPAVGGSWPSALPAGLAVVVDDPTAPSSAFRKLEEALACMGRWPQTGERAVDLGAAPGGWTCVLLRHGVEVAAIDRSPLAPHLAAHPRLAWQRGDAFSYRPVAPVDWLVSDVAAYPERVAELLEIWCGERLSRWMVVQMKFTGEVDWSALDVALTTARRHGYGARARHFFNDKNEVTLMAGRGAPTRASQDEEPT